MTQGFFFGVGLVLASVAVVIFFGVITIIASVINKLIDKTTGKEDR